MTRAQFRADLERLVGAFRREALHPERAEALWRWYGSLPAEVWSNAVEYMLRDSYYPARDKIQHAVEWAFGQMGERRRKEREAAADKAAKRGETPPEPICPDCRDNASGMRWWRSGGKSWAARCHCQGGRGVPVPESDTQLNLASV